MAKINWREEVDSDSKLFIKEYEDEITEQIIDCGEASTDLNNDYHNGDAFIHENYTDRTYKLLEAAELLDQLNDWTETDHGLWKSLEPREAIGAQAAYTYTNAVISFIMDRIKNINEECGDLEPSETEDEKVIRKIVQNQAK